MASAQFEAIKQRVRKNQKQIIERLELQYMTMINALLMQKCLIAAQINDSFAAYLADTDNKQRESVQNGAKNAVESEEYIEESALSFPSNSNRKKRKRAKQTMNDETPKTKKRRTESDIWQNIKKLTHEIVNAEIELHGNTKWLQWEIDFVLAEYGKNEEKKEKIDWTAISCKLALHTKNVKKIGSPRRSLRAVREKGQKLIKQRENDKKEKSKTAPKRSSERIKRRSSQNKRVCVKKKETKTTKTKNTAPIPYSDQEKADLLRIIAENEPKNDEKKRDLKYFEEILYLHTANGWERTAKALSGWWYRWQQKQPKRKKQKVKTVKEIQKKTELDDAETESECEDIKKSKEEEKVYCVCRRVYDETKAMTQCNLCDEWFHNECVGLSKDRVKTMTFYVCSECSKKTENEKMKKKRNPLKPLGMK